MQQANNPLTTTTCNQCKKILREIKSQQRCTQSVYDVYHHHVLAATAHKTTPHSKQQQPCQSRTGFGQDPLIHNSITCNAPRGGPKEHGRDKSVPKTKKTVKRKDSYAIWMKKKGFDDCPWARDLNIEETSGRRESSFWPD
eukprot:3185266-Rhodomonas_salina.1